MTRVAILMGSDSDKPIMDAAVEVLKEFGIDPDVRILSAHRTPDMVQKYITQEAPQKGVRVFIAAAGMAAHLAGAVAAHTHLPVIGVPLEGSALQGMDSLLSTVQMPPGVPVATVAIGKAGAKNAAYLAVQILGVADASLADKFMEFKKTMAETVLKKDKSYGQCH